MIVDVFLYAGETDMARLRAATLDGHVDRTVAVSCRLTHQGEPADLTPPPDGIPWLIVDAEPIPGGSRGGWGTPQWCWVEAQHRRAIPAALRPLDLPADALVLVSDVDEIPDPATLHEIAAEVDRRRFVAVPMRMHGFALDFLHPGPWSGTTACRLADLDDPQRHREARFRLPQAGHGWHFSWFGTLAEKRRKLDTFSHAELAQQGLDVAACYRTGTHSNGEQMTRLTAEDIAALDWPKPLFTTFDQPPSWWSPAPIEAGRA